MDTLKKQFGVISFSNNQKLLKIENKLDKGTVSILYLKGFSEIFKRIISKRGVKTAFQPGLKIKELRSTARTPLVKIVFMPGKRVEF